MIFLKPRKRENPKIFHGANTENSHATFCAESPRLLGVQVLQSQQDLTKVELAVGLLRRWLTSASLGLGFRV